MRFLFGALLVFLSGGSLTERVLLDGVDGVILSLAFETDTEYAPGYSDSRFLLIQPGMSRDLVHQILGEPFESWPSDEWSRSRWDFTESWARSPTDTHRFLRQIRFRDSRVVEIVSEFYID